MLIHNAGRIYGNCTLTMCLSVMLTSSPAAVAPGPPHFLFFNLPLHVSRSLDMWGTLITQLLAQPFSFLSSPSPSSDHSQISFTPSCLAPPVIRCSSYFLFLQNLFSWLEYFYQFIHLVEMCPFCPCSRCCTALRAGSGLGHLQNVGFHLLC